MTSKKKTAASSKDRAELSGYLLASFGQAVGIDVIPFLTHFEDKETSKAMMKGRKRVLAEKSKKS